MSEKTPFEQAEDNVRDIALGLDMMKTLIDMKDVLESSEHLEEEDKKNVHEVVEVALKKLSAFMVERGVKWN